MRIRLLAPIGGHSIGDVLDHDQAAAEWLMSAGLAVHVDDENDTDEDANTGKTVSTSSDAPAAQTAPRTPPARRTSKRRPG